MFEFPTDITTMATKNGVSVSSIYKRLAELNATPKELGRSIRITLQVYISLSIKNQAEFVDKFNEKELVSKFNDYSIANIRQVRFLRDAERIHGTRYLYTKVHYVDRLSKVTITCKQHGDFEQPPATHLKGAEGCKTCLVEKMDAKRRSKKILPFRKIVSES